MLRSSLFDGLEKMGLILVERLNESLRRAAAILYVKSQYIRITIANIAFVLHDGLLYVQWAQKFNHNLLQ